MPSIPLASRSGAGAPAARLAAILARRLGAAVLVQHVIERDARGGPAVYAPTAPLTAERLIEDVPAPAPGRWDHR